MQKARHLFFLAWSATAWSLSALTIICTTTLDLLAFIFLGLIDRKRILIHWINTLWGHLTFAFALPKGIEITGLGNIKKNEPYILISNHQSLLDIVMLFHIKRQFRWVAKDDLFRVPFLGWSMSMGGNIKLERGKYGSVRQTYLEVKKWLDQGISVFFFPEGTRSRTNEMLPFKNGAFKLSLDTGVKIVPMAITGTSEIIRPGSWAFQKRADIRISILEPMDPAHYQDSGVIKMRDEARSLIDRELKKLSSFHSFRKQKFYKQVD